MLLVICHYDGASYCSDCLIVISEKSAVWLIGVLVICGFMSSTKQIGVLLPTLCRKLTKLIQIVIDFEPPFHYRCEMSLFS